jgi:hypothetical protein
MIRALLVALALAGIGAAYGNAAPPAATSVCPRPPMLALSEDFADPRGAFALRTDAFRRTGVNFAAAWRRACAQGLLRGRTLIDAGAGQQRRLFLKNAPDANVASIYLDGEEGAPAAARRMVLEYPFLTADGAAHVPGTEELGEAIFCHVQGASAEETEESGRCLPD